MGITVVINYSITSSISPVRSEFVGHGTEEFRKWFYSLELKGMVASGLGWTKIKSSDSLGFEMEYSLAGHGRKPHEIL